MKAPLDRKALLQVGAVCPSEFSTPTLAFCLEEHRVPPGILVKTRQYVKAGIGVSMSLKVVESDPRKRKVKLNQHENTWAREGKEMQGKRDAAATISEHVRI